MRKQEGLLHHAYALVEVYAHKLALSLGAGGTILLIAIVLAAGLTNKGKNASQKKRIISTVPAKSRYNSVFISHI